MANVSKFQKRLGQPPSSEEPTLGVLKEPETAPAAPPQEPEASPVSTPTRVAEPAPVVKVKREDGRSARRTGRTLPFATRVSLEWDTRFRAVSKRDNLTFGELLEKTLEAYEKRR
jgi:hypothetical protein